MPEMMDAWVIRQEREGEPTEAFQLEQIEVPEPGAFEVIVRVMAAGVNYNNVWAALGKPVSVFGYGDHPEYGHHIGGSDASGIVWKVGEAVTRWKPGDEVVMHTAHISYEDVEVHGLDPTVAPSSIAWGYETTWGSFAQFTKVQAQQLLPRPQNLSWAESASYGLAYFTAHRMLFKRCETAGRPQRLDLGSRGRPRRLRHPALQGRGRQRRRRRLLRGEGRAGQAARRGRLHQPQRVRRDDADSGQPRRSRQGQGALQGLPRLRQAGQGDPRRRSRHRLRARRPGETFPTSVFTCKPFGKVVICGATSGFQLDFDARYLWMRQKQIVGSHGANAYECMKANQLMAEGKVRPVLWRTMEFAGVPEAHQLMHENKHLGKISILVGAESEDEGRNEAGPGAIRVR